MIGWWVTFGVSLELFLILIGALIGKWRGRW